MSSRSCGATSSIRSPLPATYEVAVFFPAASCPEVEPVIGPYSLTVDAGDDITVAAIWTSDGPDFAVWPNDSSCYDAATPARLTVRHGASTTTPGNPSGDVDVVGFVGGTETVIVPDLGEGDQATLDLPAPLTVTDVSVVGSESGETFIDLGDVSLEAGNQYVVYAGGGNDGDAGVFVDVIPMDPCEVPVEPTTRPRQPRLPRQ